MDSLLCVAGQAENPAISHQHGHRDVGRQHAAASSVNQHRKERRDVAAPTSPPLGVASSGPSQAAVHQAWPATQSRVRSAPSWTPSSEHVTPNAAISPRWASQGTTSRSIPSRSIPTAANNSPKPPRMQAATNLRAAQRRGPNHTSQDCRTTLIVRHIPAHYNREKLLEEWVPDLTFNFVHLPWDARKRRYRGFAFINFVTNQHAQTFMQRWVGRKLRDHGGANPLDITFANVQGITAIIEHLRSRHGIRMQAPRFLPAVFLGAVRVDFCHLIEFMDAQNANIVEHRDSITDVANGTPWWQGTRPHASETCVRWSC